MEVPSHIHCSRFLSSTLSRTSSFWTLSVPANECLSVANSQSCPWRHRRHIHRWRQMAVLRRRHGRTAAGQWLDYGPCLVPSAVPTVNIHQSPVSSSVSSGGTVGLRAVVRIRAVHICILKIQTCGAKIWVTLFLYIIVHNSPALPQFCTSMSHQKSSSLLTSHVFACLHRISFALIKTRFLSGDRAALCIPTEKARYNDDIVINYVLRFAKHATGRKCCGGCVCEKDDQVQHPLRQSHVFFWWRQRLLVLYRMRPTASSQKSAEEPRSAQPIRGKLRFCTNAFLWQFSVSTQSALPTRSQFPSPHRNHSGHTVLHLPFLRPWE